MSLKILQSVDSGGKHEEMLNLTSEVNLLYAQKYGHDYEKFIGTKGRAAVDASYNVLYLLNDELTSGNHDWILWLDADAFVWDHSIDVNTAVVDSQYALIGTAGSPINDGQDGHKTQTEIQWDINSGVFFVNMKHDKTKEVLELSKELYLANINFEDITDFNTIGTVEHLTDLLKDHGYINEAIYRVFNEEPTQNPFVKVFNDSTNQYRYINYMGSLIRHVLDDTDENHIINNRQNQRDELTGLTWDQRLELVQKWTAEVKGE